MINVYDFDKTIYNGDSSIDFYLFCIKRNPLLIRYIFITMKGIILYKLKLRSKEYLKEKYFVFLKGIKDIDVYINDFWNKNIHKIKKWYLKQKMGSDVIISASPDFLLKPLIKLLNINGVIATKINKKTGLLESKNCHDYEKIKRFEEEYPNMKINCFYTDSIKNDKPLLLYAKNSYIVKKNKIIKW